MTSPVEMRGYSLLPFPGDRNGPDLRTTGSIGRDEGRLSFACTLQGDLSGLVLPEPEEPRGRKKHLWEETCVELFLGVKGSRRYREFNLSPAGHWNVYRFDGLREDMCEDPAFPSLPFDVRVGPDVMEISMELEVGTIFPAEKTLRIGVAAVVKTMDGRTVHLAMSHPGPRPDFHRWENFALELPPG